MIENLLFLPAWITRAGVPALSVMAFFWKGDEALSDDFKKWLSQKISGVKLTVPNIAGIEPLGRIFDFIYGRRYFALTTFLRVAAVSLVALFATSLVVAGGVAQGIAAFRAMPMDIDGPMVIKLLGINVVFDYLSITKSRLLINCITALKLRGRDTLFVTSDLIVTCFIVGFYFVFFYEVFLGYLPPNPISSIPFQLSYAPNLILFPIVSFTLTTFMTALLTILYALALMSLRIFNLMARATRLMQWMLPIQELPVRSIGIVAGALLFCFLEIF